MKGLRALCVSGLDLTWPYPIRIYAVNFPGVLVAIAESIRPHLPQYLAGQSRPRKPLCEL